MCADMTDPWGGDTGDDDGGDAPIGSRQYGMRPYPRQYGMRPAPPQYGMRFDPRQYGMRLDPRQYGMRPVPPQYGMRQTRQYGMRKKPRQYGMRPEMLEDQAAAVLDADEWTADVTMLFCNASAVMRLGARLVFGGDALPVPEVPLAGPAYNAPGLPKPQVGVNVHVLRPASHELAVTVLLHGQLARDVADRPDVAWAVKEDLANALARSADTAFLNGPGAPQIQGVAGSTPATAVAAGPDLLSTARDMVSELRGAGPNPAPAPLVPFRSAGWVLDPGALARLAGTVTDNALARAVGRATAGGRGRRSLDDTDLLAYDGHDGGVLLGYPFVVSEGAGGANNMFLSADWGEAWIGVDSEILSVDFATDAGFNANDVVVRAVLHHDFIVRRPQAFRHT